ncbi:hypothetical protein CL621_04610 [archaeon]|nr:hypothetical protein [archaeon]|tara:strand:+ start:1852 stop:2289 length:438 start_codon:yes stop_codon:yes gene_type:complete
MNKKGYIRTLEAVIAIIIILVFVLTVLQPKYKKESEPAEIKLLQDTIINELEEDENYRNIILNCDDITTCDITTIKEDLIEPMIGKVGDYEYYLYIQDAGIEIPLEIPSSLPGEIKIYAKGIMISTTLEGNYDPKIVVLYLWEEE